MKSKELIQSVIEGGDPSDLLEARQDFQKKTWDAQKAALELPRFEFVARMAWRLCRRDKSSTMYRIEYKRGKWTYVTTYSKDTTEMMPPGTAAQLYEHARRTDLGKFFQEAENYREAVHVYHQSKR